MESLKINTTAVEGSVSLVDALSPTQLERYSKEKEAFRSLEKELYEADLGALPIGFESLYRLSKFDVVESTLKERGFEQNGSFFETPTYRYEEKSANEQVKDGAQGNFSTQKVTIIITIK